MRTGGKLARVCTDFFCYTKISYKVNTWRIVPPVPNSSIFQCGTISFVPIAGQTTALILNLVTLISDTPTQMHDKDRPCFLETLLAIASRPTPTIPTVVLATVHKTIRVFERVLYHLFFSLPYRLRRIGFHICAMSNFLDIHCTTRAGLESGGGTSPLPCPERICPAHKCLFLDSFIFPGQRATIYAALTTRRISVETYLNLYEVWIRTLPQRVVWRLTFATALLRAPLPLRSAY